MEDCFNLDDSSVEMEESEAVLDYLSDEYPPNDLIKPDVSAFNVGLGYEKQRKDDLCMSTSGTFKSDASVSTDSGKHNKIGVEEDLKLGHNVESELKEDSSDNVNSKSENLVPNCSPRAYKFISFRHKVEKSGEKVQTKPRTQNCTVCDRDFDNRNDLERHIFRAHIRYRKEPFNSETCDKCYTRKHSRIINQKLHTDEHYRCKICEKTFTSYGDLTLDMKIHNHTPENFKCDICSKSFSSRILYRNRQRHFEVEEKQKLVSCDICEKTFSDQSTLTDHQKTHYNKKHFMCGFCCEIFDKLAKLKKHLEIHPHVKPSEKLINRSHWSEFGIAPWDI